MHRCRLDGDMHHVTISSCRLRWTRREVALPESFPQMPYTSSDPSKEILTFHSKLGNQSISRGREEKYRPSSCETEALARTCDGDFLEVSTTESTGDSQQYE